MSDGHLNCLLYTVTIASGTRSLIVVYGFAGLRFLVTAIKWTLQGIMLLHDIGFFHDTVGCSRYAEAQIVLHLNRIENRMITAVAIQQALLIDDITDIVGCI